MSPIVAELPLTITNVAFVILLGGTIFGVYNYFHKPQVDSRVSDAITGEQLGSKATVLAQKETDTKASLLALDVQREKEFNTKKFVEISSEFSSIDETMKDLTRSVNRMELSLTKELTKVTTILEEHMKSS